MSNFSLCFSRDDYSTLRAFQWLIRVVVITCWILWFLRRFGQIETTTTAAAAVAVGIAASKKKEKEKQKRKELGRETH